MNLLWLCVLFIALLVMRFPIAYAMILTSLVSLWADELPILNLSQKIASGVDSFPLLAIPLFILAGNLMNTLGVTERIFGLANVLVRHISGGLGHVNVLASLIFAGMSGSSIADAGGLGAVEIKAMNEAGYPPAFSAAVTAASATIGPVVPPSIAMVIYAFIAQESVAALFLAGLIPGLLMAALLMPIIMILCRSGSTAPSMPRATMTETRHAIRRAIWPLLAPIILVGGILFGIFTPTEAGVVVVFYVLLIGSTDARFTATDLACAIRDTARTTSATLFIIAVSMIFGWIVVVKDVPDLILAFVSGFADSQTTVMIFIIVTMLVIGMFLEGIPAQLITVPTFLVLAAQYNIDPIHLGVVVVLTIMIGSLTPPVGLVLYTVMATTNIRMIALVKALWPFYLVLLIATLLVALVPSIALWLPTTALNN